MEKQQKDKLNVIKSKTDNEALKASIDKKLKSINKPIKK